MEPTLTDVAAYWNSRPCNIRRSAAPTDSKQFMDETEARKYTSEPHIPGFAEFDKWAGKYVLEIGCGIGIDTVNFARAGANVTAVDLSEESLRIAKRRADLANVPLRFIQSNAEELSLCDPAYHLIYAFGSIHHSPRPVSILREMRKYSGKVTTLKIMVYNKWSWKALWILLKYGKGQFWKFSELIARYSEAQTGCPVTHVYSRRSIKKLVESAGFRVKKISVDHVFKFDIPSYIKHEYKVDWKFRWMPSWLFRAFERVAGWHLLVEATA
jgi:ubiquinone/menaquinone biosynthesis C-methylase UbiE